MKRTSIKKRRISISLILSVVMAFSVFGDCGAVLAMSNTNASNDQAQQAKQAQQDQQDQQATENDNAAVELEAQGIDEAQENKGLANEAQENDLEAQVQDLNVKVTNSGRTATISWTPDASLGSNLHYAIRYTYRDYQQSPEPEKSKELKTAADNYTQTSITEKLVYFNDYYFVVDAIAPDGHIIASEMVPFTPKMSNTGVVTGLKAMSGNKRVTLQWSAAKKPADDSSVIIFYRVYRGDKLIAKVKDTGNKKTYQYVDKGRTEGKTYEYAVRLVYRKNTPGYTFNWTDPDTKEAVSGAYQLVLSKNKKEVKRGPIRPIQYNFTVSSYAPYYTTYKGTGVGGHFSAGTKYTATGAINTRYIITVNGKTRYLPTKYTKDRSAEYKNGNKEYYSKAEAQDYVNSRKISSRTKYMIWVSAYSQRCFLFKKSGGKWKCVNSYLCSTGGLNTPTPTGKLRIWSRLMSRHGLKYWNNFYSLTALHQSPAKKMGYPSSRGGCVRLKNNIAKYIYYNVPMNTRVLVY